MCYIGQSQWRLAGTPVIPFIFTHILVGMSTVSWWYSFPSALSPYVHKEDDTVQFAKITVLKLSWCEEIPCRSLNNYGTVILRTVVTVKQQDSTFQNTDQSIISSSNESCNAHLSVG